MKWEIGLFKLNLSVSHFTELEWTRCWQADTLLVLVEYAAGGYNAGGHTECRRIHRWGWIYASWQIYYQWEDILLDWTHRSVLSPKWETLKLSLNSPISRFILKSRVNLRYPTWIPDRFDSKLCRFRTELGIDPDFEIPDRTWRILIPRSIDRVRVGV